MTRLLAWLRRQYARAVARRAAEPSAPAICPRAARRLQAALNRYDRSQHRLNRAIGGLASRR